MKIGKYMLYAHDGTGIGHAVRTCNLAGTIRTLHPSHDVSIATGSQVAKQYLPSDVHLLQLPPQERIDRSVAQAEIAMQWEERERLTSKRRQMLLEYAQNFLPDVLLVDHLALGKRDELDQAVKFLHGSDRSLFLGYRRILEDRHSTEKVFTYGPFRSALVAYFKAIIVYAPPWIEEVHGPLTDIPIPQIHIGFVCRREEMTKEVARQQFGLPVDHKVVVCCLGGGRDSWSLARPILDSWHRLRPSQASLLFFAGPHLSAPVSELGLYTKDSSITIVRDSPHFPRGIVAADAVLTTGGYNSILEALAQGRPTWAIPNQHFECEQENSLKYFGQLGLVNHVSLDNDREKTFRTVFRKILDEKSIKTFNPPVEAKWFQGAKNTAKLLQRYLQNPNCKLSLGYLG